MVSLQQVAGSGIEGPLRSPENEKNVTTTTTENRQRIYRETRGPSNRRTDGTMGGVGQLSLPILSNFYLTRSSGRYAPFLLAPAEGWGPFGPLGPCRPYWGPLDPSGIPCPNFERKI